MLDPKGLGAAIAAGWIAYAEDQQNPGIGLVPDPQDNVTAAMIAAITAYLASTTSSAEGEVKPVACRWREKDEGHWSIWHYQDGTGPCPSPNVEVELFYPASALALQQKQLDEAQALFDECAVARDASGFIGTVPQCIEHWCSSSVAAEAALSARDATIGEMRGALNIELNVTDDELLRIRNDCEHLTGDIKLWARMLQKIVDGVRRARTALSSVDNPTIEGPPSRNGENSRFLWSLGI